MQLLQPLAVQDIALSAGNILDMASINPSSAVVKFQRRDIKLLR